MSGSDHVHPPVTFVVPIHSHLPTPRIRLAIVDDHPCFRRGMALIFGNVPELEVVLEAANGVDYERKVAEVGHVDLVLVDRYMKERDGFETIRWIGRHHPRTKCIFFSFQTDPCINRRAMRVGARAVLNKTCDYTELIRAIHSVVKNDFYYNEEVTKAMRLSWENEALQEERDLEGIVAAMTVREKEFILHYARLPFPTMKQMEDKLGLKYNGTEDLRRRVVERTGCNSRELMIDFLMKTGLK